MKLLTYILIIVFPLTLLAHKASKEEIDKLKAQADSARQEYRTARNKFKMLCNEKDLLKLRLSESSSNFNFRKNLVDFDKACRKSTDPEITIAIEEMRQAYKTIRELRKNSIEYKVQKRAAYDRYLNLKEAAGKDESTDHKVAKADQYYQMVLHRWQFVKSSIDRSVFEARSKFYKACRKSTDPQVKEAYQKYQEQLPKCFRLRESYIDARGKLEQALAAYNEIKHLGENPSSHRHTTTTGGDREQSRPSGSTTAGSGAVR